MSDQPQNLKFTEQAKQIVLAHLSDENFGVAELADAMHMSRSNLLRKCKKQTQLSASQFIREIRLEQAKRILQDSENTVSEVAYQVGFGSASYFIKCFREKYGFPPGEINKHEEQQPEPETLAEQKTENASKSKLPFILAAVFIVLVVGAVIFWPTTTPPFAVAEQSAPEKSIAVLPFKNESSDSTNLYFVNGLMEAALGNLQKIEDLRVISRTSVEKYRNSGKNISEIAQELGVNYIVEGSGQKAGNEVLLNIQLIDASTDTRLWGNQYAHQIVDIFALQNEVAKKIADAVEAKITPAELEQIDKKPTQDLVAYDYYLQAQEPYFRRTKEGLLEAIPLFKKAIEQDPEFALVYADLAISYYHLDLYKKEKEYTDVINNYADKALLYDSKLAESLIAKALYYMHTGDYNLAVPHLEKALEYNPNSSDTVQLLALLYSNFLPDTAQYLEYALKGLQLDVATENTVARSYIYLTLSNAFIQAGFTYEALEYINKSLEANPENYYAPYVKAYILYAKNKDLEATLISLKAELKKDTSRLDILQEVAKLHYYKKQYDSAYKYYRRFDNIRKERGLDVYPQEDIKIAIVYQDHGFAEESQQLFDTYAAYCEADTSIYQPASMAVKYAYEGELDKGIEQLKKFAEQDHFQYWILLFMELDPAYEPLRKHPEYDKIVQKIEDRFWANHNELKADLEDQGLL